jgi:D-aminoacyl-tRNA deacylase
LRALIQKVQKASVVVENQTIGEIGKGLLIFLGVGKNDCISQAEALTEKILSLRLFPNDEGKFDFSVQDISGEILVVSQFTLYGNGWKGRRPDFTAAASPKEAEALYEAFVQNLQKIFQKPVKTGIFGAHMEVSLVNDGPVTLWLEKD